MVWLTIRIMCSSGSIQLPKLKIVGKPMLDKFLTGENVKVNGEIAGTF
jgi:hypothetical protein